MMVVICHTHRQDENGEGEESRKKGYQKVENPDNNIGNV